MSTQVKHIRRYKSGKEAVCGDKIAHRILSSKDFSMFNKVQEEFKDERVESVTLKGSSFFYFAEYLTTKLNVPMNLINNNYIVEKIGSIFNMHAEKIVKIKGDTDPSFEIKLTRKMDKINNMLGTTPRENFELFTNAIKSGDKQTAKDAIRDLRDASDGLVKDLSHDIFKILTNPNIDQSNAFKTMSIWAGQIDEILK